MKRNRKSKSVFKIVIPIAAVVLLIVVAGLTAKYVMRYSTYGKYEADASASVGRVEYVVPELGTPYLIKYDADGNVSDDFKIITTTDLHLHTKDADLTIEALSRYIDKEKPDLVIMLGDNFMSDYNEELYDKLKAMFEEKNQYWAFVLGNHDDEGFRGEGITQEESRKRTFEALLGSPRCIARDEGGDDVFGTGNYAVNIRNSTGISQTLFFFDSGSHAVEEYCMQDGFDYSLGGYDYIKQNQIDWYETRLNEIALENGGVMPKSMAYMHIAPKEFADACELKKNKSEEVEWLFGDNWEGIGASYFSKGFFQKAVDLGSTQAIVFGHDHVNNTALKYKGITLMYSQGLQYDTYNRRDGITGDIFVDIFYHLDNGACFYIDGVTVQTIKADGSVVIAPRYAQQDGVLDGLEAELEDACNGKNTYLKKFDL